MRRNGKLNTPMSLSRRDEAIGIKILTRGPIQSEIVQRRGLFI